jgi:hypothetical protein
MPILAVLDEGAHGALDESLKSLYVQNSETKQFYLDIAPDEAAKVAFNLQKQFDNKKTELTNKHKELNEAKAKVAAFEGLGKSADEIKAALESNRPEAVTELMEKHRTELESLKKSYEEPLTQATEKAKRYEAQVQQSLADAAISKLIADHELDPETAPAILRDYVKAVPKEEGSDEYRTQIFENGSPALVAGQPMSGEQLLNGWREGKKFQRMFLAGEGGGSGAPAKQGGAFGGKNIPVSRAAVKADVNVFRAAEEQAAKVGGQVVLTD